MGLCAWRHFFDGAGDVGEEDEGVNERSGLQLSPCEML